MKNKVIKKYNLFKVMIIKTNIKTLEACKANKILLIKLTKQ